MAFKNGGQIVTDGLMLALDASSPRSYDGDVGGTTWTDISGNGYDGTLSAESIGTVSSSINTMALDGVDGTEISLAVGNNVDFITGDFSVSFWFYGNGLLENKKFFALQESTTYSVYQLRTGGGAGEDILCQSSVSQSWLTATSENVVAQLESNWNMITLTRTDTTASLYINTSGSVMSSQVHQTFAPSTGTFLIGAREGVADEVVRGNMANFMIYDRVLTQAEITQNYNVLKGRFD